MSSSPPIKSLASERSLSRLAKGQSLGVWGHVIGSRDRQR